MTIRLARIEKLTYFHEVYQISTHYTHQLLSPKCAI